MALGMLINGQWLREREQEDAQGRFLRPPTTFRHWIKADGSTPFQPQPDRYHLYVSLACPWAHRTLILRKLKGLETVISVSIVDPYMGDEGWFFSEAPGSIPDRVNHTQYLREIYLKVDPHYTGRVTVPVLWDKHRQTIVNNESREIMRMLDTEFDSLARQPVSFYPAALQPQIDETITALYQPINNGVYRAGFATTQAAYEEAVTELFQHLDHWDGVLQQQRYLCGNQITEADWCFFTTLLRFDPVYYSHFKCNLRRISDYAQLGPYLRDLYQYGEVKETCDLDQIKQHYYRSHTKINPSGIVPKGPLLDLEAPHDRERFTQPGA
uniref:Putative glutathione S-transferase n=1 Tax=Cyanothece sp. (strain PCC 7425 / ATCC 29141) TaxID=395961 RepID=B8HTE3_CYAP4